MKISVHHKWQKNPLFTLLRVGFDIEHFSSLIIWGLSQHQISLWRRCCVWRYVRHCVACS